jgi:hypothetical protein
MKTGSLGIDLDRIEMVIDKQANEKTLSIGEVIVSLEEILKKISPEAWQVYRKIDHLLVREYAQTIDSVYKLGYETGRNEAFSGLGLWEVRK